MPMTTSVIGAIGAVYDVSAAAALRLRITSIVLAAVLAVGVVGDAKLFLCDDGCDLCWLCSCNPGLHGLHGKRPDNVTFTMTALPKTAPHLIAKLPPSIVRARSRCPLPALKCEFDRSRPPISRRFHGARVV
jgi:hypothetical protein